MDFPKGGGRRAEEEEAMKQGSGCVRVWKRRKWRTGEGSQSKDLVRLRNGALNIEREPGPTSYCVRTGRGEWDAQEDVNRNLASTSVLTYPANTDDEESALGTQCEHTVMLELEPGTSLVISVPNATANLSVASCTCQDHRRQFWPWRAEEG